MADPIVVRVEIPDAEFASEYEVDPDRPLVDLVRRIADEEGIPLVTRQGRPLAWEAEGPDWRPGKEGRTDLTRTQPLSKIVDALTERGVSGSPLFMVSLIIPGAGEAIGEAREEAKRKEIEERLAQRQAERHAEREARGEPVLQTEAEMIPFQPDGDDDAEDDVVTTEMSAAIEDAETEMMPPPPRPPRQALDVRDPKPVEQRIRRGGAAGAGAAGAGTAGATATGETRRRKKKKGKKGKGGGSSSAAPGTTIAGYPVTWVVGGAAAATLMLAAVVVIAVVASKEPEPEPTPEPTPEEVPDVVVDIPMATPAPTPEPVVETPPPRKFTTFYSTSTVDRNSAGSVGAQISSFAKSEVKVGYRATGSHTVRLKGRFDLYVGESASTLEGASSRTCKGAPSGKETKVFIHWEGDSVTARVGNSRCGPVSVKGTSGFPGWKFEPGAGMTMTKLWASAPDDEG